MGKYQVTMDFRHRGDWVRPGDPVDLDDETARQRLHDGQVKAAQAPSAPAPSPASSAPAPAGTATAPTP
jgi:hypothetical protein